MRDWDRSTTGERGINGRDTATVPARETGLLHTTGHRLWGELTRTYLHTYHRMRVEGRRHLPDRPPFILVSNHSSHLDAPALAALFKWPLRDSVFPVAADDTFFRSPMHSLIAAGLINAIAMSRDYCGPHALENLRQGLVEGRCGYIMFPEGTRSRDGRPAPFKHGVGWLVAGTSVPVIPCHLSGTFESLPAECRWPRPKRVVVRIGEPCVFDDTENCRDGWREVAEALEARVRALAAR